ncbi:MAG: hypothetical protein US58_C0032G0009 [Candidatus Magasanikbacteria bacterium GW2011_GWA2_37_8]|uniref:Uncharacterized protein n=1 Tax=Candidatus Magasanikbacteria bacterium GW2011_GWA2_37_8 TaxID=1619036 RepID=A0A0G0HLM6_9BACT|nr:MAG: hypothetical protein US58_C0032G0009 [Candidatus Magasanikbacteria bacterium GW2011_GWA2_37_8]
MGRERFILPRGLRLLRHPGLPGHVLQRERWPVRPSRRRHGGRAHLGHHVQHVPVRRAGRQVGRAHRTDPGPRAHADRPRHHLGWAGTWPRARRPVVDHTPDDAGRHFLHRAGLRHVSARCLRRCAPDGYTCPSNHGLRHAVCAHEPGRLAALVLLAGAQGRRHRWSFLGLYRVHGTRPRAHHHHPQQEGRGDGAGQCEKGQGRGGRCC